MNRLIIIISILGLILSATLAPFGFANSFSQQDSPLTANLIGIKINPQNPSNPEFIINFENKHLNKSQQRAQFNKLVHYFQDAVSVPGNNLWVDPYQKSKNISRKFGKTDLGHDLLAQSYRFKKLAFSLHYYHKIWFVPGNVVISQKSNSLYIKKAPLKIMTDPSVKGQINRSVLLKIESYVNESNDFYLFRQFYKVIILANLYKQKMASK